LSNLVTLPCVGQRREVRTAIILAGGYGTRLYPLTQTRAKSLLPLAGVPLIRRLVDYLESYGFVRVILTLNNFSEQIKDNLRDFDHSCELIISEEPTPLGTAGSVKNASSYLEESFLVIQGDTVTEFDLSEPKARHSVGGELATILLSQRRDVTGLGVVDLDPDGYVSRFIEKPLFSDGRPRFVSTGIYFLEPAALDEIPSGKPFDFAKDLFPLLLGRGAKIKGVPMDGYWVDMGTPRAYHEANMWFLESKMDGRVQGTLGRGCEVKGSSMAGTNVSIDPGAVVEKCVLGDGVIIAKGAVVRNSIVLERTKIDSEANVDFAIVGEGSLVGRGARVEFGAVLGGEVTVMPRAWVGRNSIIPARSKVGASTASSEEMTVANTQLARK
jgi:mannose-1-phosphate guanylyltransferase / phosphomannomutase